jgi:hydrogenase maturation protein HypF
VRGFHQGDGERLQRQGGDRGWQVGGEGAVALTLQDRAESFGPRAAVGAPGALFAAHGADLVRAAFGDLVAGVPRSVIAARFHHGVAGVIEDGCLLLRERYGLGTVALSGGVFQNTLLLHRAVTRLEAHGFTVLTHSRVPCNDGGISLGQAAVAAARDRRGTVASPADS